MKERIFQLTPLQRLTLVMGVFGTYAVCIGGVVRSANLFMPDADSSLIGAVVGALLSGAGVLWLIWTVRWAVRESWFTPMFVLNHLGLTKSFPGGKAETGLWENLDYYDAGHCALRFCDGTVISLYRFFGISTGVLQAAYDCAPGNPEVVRAAQVEGIVGDARTQAIRDRLAILIGVSMVEAAFVQQYFSQGLNWPLWLFGLCLTLPLVAGLGIYFGLRAYRWRVASK